MMRLLLVPHAETAGNAEGRYQGHTDVPLNDRGRRQAVLLGARLARDTIDIAYTSDLRRARDTAVAIARRDLPLQPEPRLRELHFGSWEGLSYSQIQQADSAALAAWHADPERVAPPGGETLADLRARLQSFLDELLGPGAVTEISQWSSARSTTGSRGADGPTPKGSQSRALCDPAGVDPLAQPLPGGRANARPPANLWDPCGVQMPACNGTTRPVPCPTVLLVAHRGSLRVLLCLALGLAPTALWRFRLDAASMSELELYGDTAVLTRLNDTHHLREAAHAG